MSEINLFELDRLSRAERARPPDPHRGRPLRLPRARCAAIVEAVRAEGDAAVVRLAPRDRQASTLDPARLLATRGGVRGRRARRSSPRSRRRSRYAVDNIRRFHERQKPEPMWLMEIRPGAFAGERWTPIPSVACYVPRGKGAFPSVMMMTTIPAVVAGVPEIAVLTPPTPEGGIDAASLFAARMAGVERVYRRRRRRGGRGRRVRHRDHPARPRKIVGPGQPLGGGRQAAARRPDRHRPAGRPERIDRARRRHRQRPASPRSTC